MTTVESRITELTKRQVYYGSSMTVKLNSVNGYFNYQVLAWIENKFTASKITVLKGKYNGEDPEDLITLALKEIGLKKLKLGVPIP